ncbi:MAG: hypothetical protein JXR37_02600 [Kiritimatiellae bacterium]|nr:hypothetical protein [Kiritimatiellia bacterium]
MSKHARLLAILLRLMGTAERLALGAVFTPRAWMALVHERLGLGAFPAGPIAPYLARCVSAFYALHGGMLWLAASDVRRYAGLITCVAVTGMAFAVLISVLDIQAGFPWLWLIAEGPFLVVLSVVFLWLQRKVAEGNRE